jgi:AraC-like DNA-binding protein
MNRNARPAVDPAVVSAFGTTKDGQPLSYNRAPAAELSAWIARLSVTKIEMPAGYTLNCGLFADTAGLRVQLAGAFEVESRGGVQRYGRGSLFCGPHSRRMVVRVSGTFISVAASIRPSATMPLRGCKYRDIVDLVMPTQEPALQSVPTLLEPDASPEQWLGQLEDVMLGRIEDMRRTLEPEPVTARFEEIVFADPAMSVAQAAREIGVDRRRLERLVSRDFAMPPKQVLKRARALDMASQLRGVADGNEAEAMALRYYDESHLIREFVELFGMSPRQFTALPQPLLTMNLEMRQARRLEMLGRLEPGAKRPWE